MPPVFNWSETPLPVTIHPDAAATLFRHAEDRNVQDFLRVCRQLAAQLGCKIGKVMRSAVDREGKNFIHHLIPFCTRPTVAFIERVLDEIEGPKTRVSIGFILCHKNREGVTPSLMIADSGVESLIRIFTRYGVTPAGFGPDGETPLRIALYNGHFGTAMALLAAGALVNEGNRRGQTPLHMAARENRYDIVVWLLEGGAGESINKRDDDDRTPMGIVQSRGYARLEELFHLYREAEEPDPNNPVWQM